MLLAVSFFCHSDGTFSPMFMLRLGMFMLWQGHHLESLLKRTAFRKSWLVLLPHCAAGFLALGLTTGDQVFLWNVAWLLCGF